MRSVLAGRQLCALTFHFEHQVMTILPSLRGFVLGLALSLPVKLIAITVPEIVAKAKPAVVQIVAVDANQNPFKTGTGFFVSSDGLLLTNYHVIAGASDLFARTSTGAIFIFRSVVFRSVDLDVVLLKFAAIAIPTWNWVVLPTPSRVSEYSLLVARRVSRGQSQMALSRLFETIGRSFKSAHRFLRVRVVRPFSVNLVK